MRTATETIVRDLAAKFESAHSYNKGTLRFIVRVERETFADGTVKDVTHYSKEDTRRMTSSWAGYTTYLTSKHFNAAIARAAKSQDWK